MATADEVHQLTTRKDATGELFREIAEKGHYAGRTKPTGTRQGIYAAAPSGAFLASINTRDPRRVEGMLREALEKWEAMPESERFGDEPDLGGQAWSRLYPDDGMVLQVFSRDLPGKDASGDWRDQAWNQDFAWFQRQEMLAMIPEVREVGQTVAVDPTVVRRIASLHLVDNVRGQVPAFADADVKHAEMTSTIESVQDGEVRVRFEGRTRTEASGVWSVNGHRDTPKDHRRGVACELLGRGVFDLELERFTALEIVAIGERWGGAKYNARADDLDRGGIGFLLTLSDQEARVAPAFIWRYGW